LGKDPDGKVRLGFRVTGSLNRFQDGLAWNKLTDWGGAIVGEKVDIECNLQMVRNGCLPFLAPVGFIEGQSSLLR
jgi:hypothetical protein